MPGDSLLRLILIAWPRANTHRSLYLDLLYYYYCWTTAAAIEWTGEKREGNRVKLDIRDIRSCARAFAVGEVAWVERRPDGNRTLGQMKNSGCLAEFRVQWSLQCSLKRSMQC
jgi:hypothetical protein